MTQFKVVKTSFAHEFKVNEVVTKAEVGSAQERFFRELAVLTGADKHPSYATCAAYINAEGKVQVLQEDEVVEIPSTLH